MFNNHPLEYALNKVISRGWLRLRRIALVLAWLTRLEKQHEKEKDD